MTFVRDDNGDRVFVFRSSKDCTPIEGGGSFTTEKTYIANTGKKSRYPTILMGVGDKVFVPGGKLGPGDKVYSSAINRKATDPTFDYAGYSRSFNGEKGFMIRCIERKK